MVDYESTGEILLVEDNEDTREVMRRTLERNGWEVVEAVNGIEALAHLERIQPALILLDLMMPEMDGFQFLRVLRRQPAGHLIPVIVVTAKELTEEERLQLNGYVKQVLHKGSYPREELLRDVKAWVDRFINVT